MPTFFVIMFMILVSEIGDKTQLLCMSLGARHNHWKVLFGLIVAVSLNHGLACAFGAGLGNIIPFHYMQIIASLGFIVFGLLAIKKDTFDTSKGIILTIFLAEMGDKTQLATIAFASQHNPVIVWAATCLGMVIGDGAGIFVGKWLTQHIPVRVVEIISATAFIFFGVFGLISVLTKT